MFIVQFFLLIKQMLSIIFARSWLNPVGLELDVTGLQLDCRILSLTRGFILKVLLNIVRVQISLSFLWLNPVRLFANSGYLLQLIVAHFGFLSLNKL